MTTPATPSYVSGHAAFGAAAASVLTSAFGSKVAFTDNLYASTGSARTFPSFAAAAAEDGQSRVWAGVNFSFDVQPGPGPRRQGRRLRRRSRFPKGEVIGGLARGRPGLGPPALRWPDTPPHHDPKAPP